MSDYTELNLTGTSKNRLKAFHESTEDMYAIFRPQNSAEGDKIRFLSYKRIKDESKNKLGKNMKLSTLRRYPQRKMIQRYWIKYTKNSISITLMILSATVCP